ncbi:MAG: hypothetical protein CO085_08390 [Sulfurimonas sp. CG_4_9_14_0_8_um_filter_36_384]|nr:MAG: hypothetical protein COT05_04745 [Sulfurimonas sp. CG07_land_8_20_14_0_80_36_56]PIV03229.1 MAG: hypothetical protein COS56_09605 [Sulfurimonas sp. CG03_land_8_20_14_0_80_36_25]PIV60546.1 MAG: hypothetical protein COS13_06490 [Sulfurimonas sp. CG01_land_8_20_14_3_00_36_23]PIW24087.1 MAG: hypothetical protein COW31_08535 [Sulfurimonas sp. CG15_BIG_FIL_POST_REV_8_21_14_020_36_339]PIW52716.1 MAG: hypothetical protein COW17_07005 [Sulfurimonas sp. CG12_big_fil_rev_8_21_14_0_65_36_1453]PIX63
MNTPDLFYQNYSVLSGTVFREAYTWTAKKIYTTTSKQKRRFKMMKKNLFLFLAILTISLHANTQISIEEFASRLATQNNINVFIDEDFKDKKISLIIPEKISDKDLFNMFKLSVEKLGFKFSKVGDTYRLSKLDSVPLDTHLYKLKYNSSGDCETVLKQLGSHYTYLKDSNAFLIKSTNNDYLEIIKYLSSIDLIQKQVMLKIIILEQSGNIAKERGVQYASIFKGVDSTVQIALNTIVAPLTSNNPTVSSVDFYSALRLLNENSLMTVKQFPYILAKNNKLFKFEAVDNIPYLVQSTKTEATNTSQQDSFDYKDVGLKINGKSFIYDDYITLDIDLIIEDLVSTLGTTTTPQTYKRALKSNTNIEYNKVLLLSGIKKNKHTENNWDIPYLSGIPFLGEIFKFSTNSDDEINITIAIEVIKSGDFVAITNE